jgi:hypothetical protein
MDSRAIMRDGQALGQPGVLGKAIIVLKQSILIMMNRVALKVHVR